MSPFANEQKNVQPSSTTMSSPFTVYGDLSWGTEQCPCKEPLNKAQRCRDPRPQDRAHQRQDRCSQTREEAAPGRAPPLSLVRRRIPRVGARRKAGVFASLDGCQTCAGITPPAE